MVAYHWFDLNVVYAYFHPSRSPNNPLCQHSCRLKERWYAEYEQWRKRDLGRRRYVYVWADGVYCHVRMDDKLCLLVIIGVDDTGRKEVLGVLDGHRESEASWTELIEQLRAQGLQLAPKLAIGDGALGFWKAVAKCWPQTAQQRCWVHKTANVLNKVPKSVQQKWTPVVGHIS